MTSVSEALGQQSQLSAALTAGVNAIDRDQVVTFTEYSKFVLPLDGYVFWVATGQTTTVSGSVHYAVDRQQNEDETLGVNTVVFTAEAAIVAFNNVSPTTMWVGSFDGLQFAFSRQADFYQQAELWHYVGRAVYPALASQIVDSSDALLARQPIVSNSLPIWLGLNSLAPVYPSFLVADNVAPPYIAVHIEPGDTTALQAAMLLDPAVTTNPSPPPKYAFGTAVPNSGASPLFQQPGYQLARDRVRVTLYGFDNQQALQYLAAVLDASLNTDPDTFGVLNMPVIRDEKRTQVELAALAQKKTIEFDISYYQTAAAVIARRLILSAAASITVL